MEGALFDLPPAKGDALHAARTAMEHAQTAYRDAIELMEEQGIEGAAAVGLAHAALERAKAAVMSEELRRIEQ